MNFVTYDQMIRDAIELAHKLPRDIVGVLGVPRSGMIPASLVATALGVHLGDVSTGFMHPGRRLENDWPPPYRGHVVIVDDTMYMGSAMRGALERVPKMYTYSTAVLYTHPDKSDVDFSVRAIKPPRIFAWNWLHNALIETAYLDMDGLICTDPDHYDDDGPGYAAALERARPKHLPKHMIACIITARLERWRSITEAWLARHGVKYDMLIMAPFATAHERRAYGAARWKAEVMTSRGWPTVYFESDESQAAQIRQLWDGEVFVP